jgi:hypothetical protein
MLDSGERIHSFHTAPTPHLATASRRACAAVGFGTKKSKTKSDTIFSRTEDVVPAWTGEQGASFAEVPVLFAFGWRLHVHTLVSTVRLAPACLCRSVRVRNRTLNPTSL